MKIKLLLLAFLLFTISSQSQDCSYDYSPNVKIHKNHLLSNSEKSDWSDSISQFKECLASAKSKKNIYWLNNAIANRTFFTDDLENVVEYSVHAFSADTVSFCKDYMSVYEASLIKDYSYDSYYMHMDTDQELREISSYCQANYNSQFNQEYIDALEDILIRDQQARTIPSANKKLKNKLDSLNRVKLDSLYTLFGFPSSEKVSYRRIHNALMVMHHSTDCKWNERWIERWLEHSDDVDSNLFSSFFCKNFNQDNGICRENMVLIDRLKTGKYSALVMQYLDCPKLGNLNR